MGGISTRERGQCDRATAATASPPTNVDLPPYMNKISLRVAVRTLSVLSCSSKSRFENNHSPMGASES